MNKRNDLLNIRRFVGLIKSKTRDLQVVGKPGTVRKENLLQKFKKIEFIN